MTDGVKQVSSVHFGTDGWRAIIGESFDLPVLAAVADATARAYRQLLDGAEAAGAAAAATEFTSNRANTLIVGYDCRLNAGKYAAFLAEIVAAHGFDVVVSDRYCPTPTLCWTVANNKDAVGGIMLTASHNPAEYLGVKLRMSDGGASPAWFSDIVEELLVAELPAAFAAASEIFELAQNSVSSETAVAPVARASFTYANLMDDYLQALSLSVNRDLIVNAGVKVVLDPMYGAGRSYLAKLLRDMDVTVEEVNGGADPTFAGLHPEPILPWVNVGAAKVAELGYFACLINDGDADRIGAVDGSGIYVSSHRIVSLLISHLVEGRGQTGRVVRTSAGSSLIKRQCQRLGLELATKPIGFKWVYEEMLAGDVLIGGEESGGFGIPSHVRERDGLLMALLLVEMMAMRRKSLAELVDELLSQLGRLEYNRRDLRLSDEQKAAFLSTHVEVAGVDKSPYVSLFEPLAEEIVELEREDGIMIRFASDAWLLARPSGTEPLVRVYAEAASLEQVEALLDIGCALARGEL